MNRTCTVYHFLSIFHPFQLRKFKLKISYEKKIKYAKITFIYVFKNLKISAKKSHFSPESEINERYIVCHFLFIVKPFRHRKKIIYLYLNYIDLRFHKLKNIWWKFQKRSALKTAIIVKYSSINKSIWTLKYLWKLSGW